MSSWILRGGESTVRVPRNFIRPIQRKLARRVRAHRLMYTYRSRRASAPPAGLIPRALHKSVAMDRPGQTVHLLSLASSYCTDYRCAADDWSHQRQC
jgi:hypothetical protein